MNGRRRRVSVLNYESPERGDLQVQSPQRRTSSSSSSPVSLSTTSDEAADSGHTDVDLDVPYLRKLPESIPSNPHVIPFSKSLLSQEALRRGERWKRYMQPDQIKNKFSHDVYDKMLSLASSTAIHNRLIEKDVDRTFPTNKLFNAPHTGTVVLSNVLRAYSVYDSETGYSQGIAFLAAFLLLHLGDEREVFWCLVALMYSDKYNMRALYRHSNCLVLKLMLEHFHKLLAQLCPELHKHLDNLGVVPSMYATQWFCTIFSSRFDQQFAGQIWDMFMVDGPMMMFQIGLSLMVALKRRLMQGELETVLPLLAAVPTRELARSVLSRARTVRLSEAFIRALMRIEPEEKPRSFSPVPNPFQPTNLPNPSTARGADKSLETPRRTSRTEGA